MAQSPPNKPLTQPPSKPHTLPRNCAKPASAQGLSIKHANAAGIDVGSKSHFVAVGARRVGPKAQDKVREFGCCTDELLALCAWLKDCGIDTVALESGWHSMSCCKLTALTCGS